MSALPNRTQGGQKSKHSSPGRASRRSRDEVRWQCDAVYTSVLPPSARIYTAENDADLASGEDMVLGLTRFALVFGLVPRVLARTDELIT
jgi:hypothetical protein